VWWSPLQRRHDEREDARTPRPVPSGPRGPSSTGLDDRRALGRSAGSGAKGAGCGDDLELDGDLSLATMVL
jgi:hypothetical protein